MGKSKKDKNQALFIYNPFAGSPADPDLRLQQAVRFLTESGLQVKVVIVKPKLVVRKVARKAVRSGYRLVIVMGGDGTIEAVLPELVKTKTRLGILMGGTQNNVAKSLGIPEDLEAACRIIAQNRCRKIDVGQIKNKKGEKAYFLEFASIGLIAELFSEAQALYDGKLTHIVQAVGEFIRYKPPKMKLIMDHLSYIQGEAPLVTISNTPTWGVVYMVAPEASLEDGLLDVSFYADISKAELLAYFTSVANGRAVKQPKIQSYRVRRIKIKAKPKQAAVADGKLLHKSNVTIRLLPGALRVITGEHLGLAKEAPTSEEASLEPPPPVPIPSTLDEVANQQS